LAFRRFHIFSQYNDSRILKCIFTKQIQGFTVIETIFSVAISGILVASVITTVFGHAQAVQAENTVNVNKPAHLEESASSIASTSLNALDLNITDSDAWQKQIENTSAQTELKIVQTAIDIMMINAGIKTVSATSATNDMASFPIGNPLYPNVLREQYSKYMYKCDSRGEITQIAISASEGTNSELTTN